MIRHLPFTGTYTVPAVVPSHSKATGQCCKRKVVIPGKANESVTGDTSGARRLGDILAQLPNVWAEVVRLLQDPTLIQQELDRRLAGTMSPTARVVQSKGATVQSCPDSILPYMEEPRGRNETVSPACSFWM